MQEEKKRKKISIDFDYDVEMLLDAHKRGRNGVSYASMINEIVRAMFGLTSSQSSSKQCHTKGIQ